MKITPVASPGQIPTNGTPESVRTAKAVAAFNKGASTYDKPQAQSPVINQNAIAPEEIGALRQNNTVEVVQDDETTEETAVVEAAAAVEPAKVEAPQEQDPALKRQFEQLAQRERQLRAQTQKQQQDLQAREQRLQALEDSLKAKEEQYRTGYVSKDQLKRNTLGVLESEVGINYDSLTAQLLNPVQIHPQVQQMIDDLKSQVTELKTAQETNTKSQADSQAQQYQQAVKQIQTDVTTMVATDPAYELIKATGSIKDVVELITETFNKDGILMSVEEAATEVEAYLEEETLKMSKLQKIQKRLQASSTPPEVKAAAKTLADHAKSQKQTQPQMKTLTNANASTRQLSAKERAILAFKGELK